MTNLIDTIGDTPLVPLRSIGKELEVEILVKCEFMNPGGSVKDRLAKAIVEDAEQRGLLTPGMTLVEATAGNTGMGLALMAADRGYGLICVMPEKMSADKRRLLRALGAEVVIAPNVPGEDPDNFKNMAIRLAEAPGRFLVDQFNNPANVEAHRRVTGAEILRQTDGRVGAFVTGAGTGGTISGVGRCLKEHDPEVRIILADPDGSTLAGRVRTGEPGADKAYAIEGIGSSQVPANLHLEVIDDAVTVSDDDSYAMARRLIREEGLLVGGSSGTHVAAALQVAASGVRGPVVTILPDSWDRYQSQPWLAGTPE